MSHAQVVEAAARDEFVVEAKEGSAFGDVEHEVEIENVGQIYLEFIGH